MNHWKTAWTLVNQNPACTATTRQESAKEIGCLQAETRQQETILPQWYLQPFRCNETQFRWSRRELMKFRVFLKKNIAYTMLAHQDDTSSVSKKAAYNNICKTVQSRLGDMQDSWLRKKAEEIQSFADRKDTKKVHGALQTVFGPRSSGTIPLLSADGSTLLTDEDTILKWWVEHFDSVLNRLSIINDNAINRLSQVECNVLLEEFPNSHWNNESK